MDGLSVVALGLEPDFLYPLENVTIPQGRDAIFTCVVNNLGGYRVSADLAPARVCTMNISNYQCPSAHRLLSLSAPRLGSAHLCHRGRVPGRTQVPVSRHHSGVLLILLCSAVM